MSNFSIGVSALQKYYGSVKAIDGISFKVEAGTVFGMLGPNGGEINILGFDPDQDLREIKARMVTNISVLAAWLIVTLILGIKFWRWE